MKSRRRFIRALGAFGVSLALPAADGPKRNMVLHSARPEDFEMPLDGFADWITPVDRFFVRSHLYTPRVDVGSWKLRVEGEVGSPVSLTLEDLKKFPRVESVSVLECAGNGRAFYQPPVAGMQWQYGAVGNARWAGVRLADVLRKAGVRASAKEIVFNGADVPIGKMPDFVRGVPIEKALSPDTVLAWEMNGEPLPASHGFPLRAIVPGWAGDSWVKWITDVQVLDREFDGFFMKTAYRYPQRTITPGSALEAGAATSPVQMLRPKSVISSPIEGSRVGTGGITIQGAAWSGESRIAGVEVSTDGGRTWRKAELGRDQAKNAWRLWTYKWMPPSAGSYVLMARATDASGATQPLVQEWNPPGYLWNVVHQVRVEVGPGPERTAAAPPRAPELPEKLRSACVVCHDADVIGSQRLTRAQWDRELDKMIGWGAPVGPGDRAGILDFLAGQFGVR